MNNSLKYKLKKYGLTESEYITMLKECNNKCMICNQPPKSKSLHIDHNHKMAKILKKANKSIGPSVRGLLCYVCNLRLIGRLGDKPDAVELFTKAAQYLKKHKEKQNEIN